MNVNVKFRIKLDWDNINNSVDLILTDIKPSFSLIKCSRCSAFDVSSYRSEPVSIILKSSYALFFILNVHGFN